MDIQTQDGILLRNIPEGTPDEEIKARIQKIRGGKVAPKIVPDQQMSGLEKMVASVPTSTLESVLPTLLKPSNLKTMRGLVQGAADPSLGLLQLGAKAVGGDGVSDAIVKQQKEYEAQAEEGFDGARLAGNVLSPANILLMKKVGIPDSALKRAGVASALGAAGGAMSPETGEDFSGDKMAKMAAGAVVGPLLSGSFDLGAKAYRGLRNLIEPSLKGGAERVAGRLAAEAAGDRKAQVTEAILKATPDLPGQKLTAAQAASDAGSAEFSALEKLMRDRKPSDFATRDALNQEARRNAIREIGGDKELLKEAIGKRAGQARVDYRAAYEQAVKADPELAQLMANPYIKDSLPNAFKIAKAKGLNPKENLTEFLQGVKLSLDDRLQKVGEGGLGATEKKLVSEAKGSLVDWMGAKNAAYDKARTNFAEASKPINRMEVGQYLEQKLVNPLETGERAGVFAQALRDAPGTLKRSTGQARYEELGQVLDPSQVKVTDAVLRSLQREKEASQLGSQGVSAARQVLGEVTNPVPQINLIDRAATVVNAITRRLEGRGTEKTTKALAELMLEDPQKLAKLMKAATPAERATLTNALAQQSALMLPQQ